MSGYGVLFLHIYILRNKIVCLLIVFGTCVIFGSSAWELGSCECVCIINMITQKYRFDLTANPLSPASTAKVINENLQFTYGFGFEGFMVHLPEDNCFHFRSHSMNF